jgi:predicted Holliday junction resolvase-like endonuclease
MKAVLQITLGILLAGLVTLLIRIGYVSYIEYRVTQGIHELAMQQEQREQARQQALKERQVAEYQRQQQAKQLAAEKSRIAKQNAIALQGKTAAWRQYYQVPEDCKNFKSDEHMVNCINHKSDAKEEFDRLYDSGELVQ